jgi:hypothetical protein
MSDWVGNYEPPTVAPVVCGKRGYESETAARAAILNVQGWRRKQSKYRHDRKPTESSTYRCAKCSQWHTTSMVQ